MAGGKLWWQVGLDPRSVQQAVGDARQVGQQMAGAMNQAGAQAGLTAGQLRALRGEWVQQRTETEKVRRSYTETNNALRLQAQQAKTNTAAIRELTAQKRSLNAQTSSLIPLTQSFNNALGAVGITLGSAGLVMGGRQYLTFLNDAALESTRAQAQITIFNKEIVNSGNSLGAGSEMLRRLADEFNTTEDAVARGALTLLRLGATTDQVEILLQRGGASALAFGKSAADGFESIGQAIAGQSSQMLNYIGIAGNISTENIRLARSMGVATDELTSQDHVLAAVNLVLRETNQEYAALPTLLAGLIGQQQDLNVQWTLAKRELGDGVNPELSNLYSSLSDLIGVVIENKDVIIDYTERGLQFLNDTIVAGQGFAQDLFNILDALDGKSVTAQVKIEAVGSFMNLLMPDGKATSTAGMVGGPGLPNEVLKALGLAGWKMMNGEGGESSSSGGRDGSGSELPILPGIQKVTDQNGNALYVTRRDNGTLWQMDPAEYAQYVGFAGTYSGPVSTVPTPTNFLEYDPNPITSSTGTPTVGVGTGGSSRTARAPKTEADKVAEDIARNTARYQQELADILQKRMLDESMGIPINQQAIDESKARAATSFVDSMLPYYGQLSTSQRLSVDTANQLAYNNTYKGIMPDTSGLLMMAGEQNIPQPGITAQVAAAQNIPVPGVFLNQRNLDLSRTRMPPQYTGGIGQLNPLAFDPTINPFAQTYAGARYRAPMGQLSPNAFDPTINPFAQTYTAPRYTGNFNQLNPLTFDPTQLQQGFQQTYSAPQFRSPIGQRDSLFFDPSADFFRNRAFENNANSAMYGGLATGSNYSVEDVRMLAEMGGLVGGPDGATDDLVNKFRETFDDTAKQQKEAAQQFYMTIVDAAGQAGNTLLDIVSGKATGGSAIAGLGGAAGSVIGAINPLIGAIIGVGTGLLGGLFDILFPQKKKEPELSAESKYQMELRAKYGESYDQNSQFSLPTATASSFSAPAWLDEAGNMFLESGRMHVKAGEMQLQAAKKNVGSFVEQP